jgi:hypothetical protein
MRNMLALKKLQLPNRLSKLKVFLAWMAMAILVIAFFEVGKSSSGQVWEERK